MCGISGELTFDGRPVDRADVLRMTSALQHRGPDDEGVYAEGGIGLGFRRLSIIDLSTRGRQPMWSSDRSMALVFNGEVYNFSALRRELEARDYVFNSTSDSEVVLNAVHCWGIEAAVARFVGMFAFAIWNASERALYLCRDRAGVKPIYYFVSHERVIFASEMKGLLAHRAFPREFDRETLPQYFVLGYFAGESTVFRRTRRLMPGHIVRFASDGSASSRRYWDLDAIERGSFQGTFQQAADQVGALCEDAFAHRLVSDVPVGLFLSGGVDSSLVASVVRKRLNADLVHLTIGFAESGFDETPKAASVARQLGVRHVVRYLDAPDAADAVRRFVDIFDEPFSDTSGMASALVSKVAREHVTVALSADGGDEQFCGYDSYRRYPDAWQRLAWMPGGVKRALAATLRKAVPYELLLSSFVGRNGSQTRPQIIARYEKFTDLLGAGTPGDLLAVMNEKAWTRSSVAGILRADVDSALEGGAAAGLGDRPDRDSLIDAMMRMDYRGFMCDDILAKVDRTSMAASLECRDPLLDHRIAELAFSLPVEYLCGGRENKRLLKHLLREWISEDVVRAPKWGFMVPLYQWMRGPLKGLVREFLAPDRVRAIGVLDPVRVTAEVDRFYAYRGCRAEKIFTLLNFQMWAERWYLSPVP